MELAVRSSWTGEVVRVAVPKTATLEELERRAAEALGLKSRCVLTYGDGQTLTAEDVEGLAADTELVAAGVPGRLTEVGRVKIVYPLSKDARLFRAAPDARSVFVVGAGAVCCVDLASGEIVQTYEGVSPQALAVSSDGEVLYTGDPRNVTKWRVADGQVLQTWESSVGDVRSVVLSPDDLNVFVGGGNGFCQLDAATGTCVRVFSSTLIVASLALSCDGTLFVGGRNQTRGEPETGYLGQWDVSAGSELRRFVMDGPLVHSIAVSPDGQTLVSTTGARTWQWNLLSGECERLLEGLREYTCSEVGLLQGGTVVASSYVGKGLFLWDLSTGKLLRKLGGPHWIRTPDHFIYASPGGELGARGHIVVYE